MITNLQRFHDDCVDAFTMECSKEDIKTNSEARKLARYIKKQGRKIKRITKLQRKILGY